MQTTLTHALTFPEFIAQAGSPPGSGFAQFIPILLLFAGMWFLIIAPQRKRQKQHEQMIADLKSGDDIVTSGGIYGTITNVKDDCFVVRIADNTKIEISRNSIGNKRGSSES